MDSPIRTKAIIRMAAALTLVPGIAGASEDDCCPSHPIKRFVQQPCCPPGLPATIINPTPVAPSPALAPNDQPTQTPPTQSSQTASAAPTMPNLDLGGGLALGESTVALASISNFGDQFSRGAARANSAIRILQPGILNGRTGRVVIPDTIYNAAAGQYEKAVASGTIGIDGIGSQPITVPEAVQQTGPHPVAAGGSAFTPDAVRANSYRAIFNGGPGFLVGSVIENGLNPNATLVFLDVGAISGLVQSQTGDLANGPFSLDYSAPLVSLVNAPIAIHVPSPSDGGVAGRVKVADDNSPLPRDRLIFNYDHFDGAALTANGVDVNRYVFGFEKTFFNGRASAELRVPIADTLSSTMTIGTDETGGELGNALATLKFLILSDESMAASVGLGVTLPTGDGIHVQQIDGSNLLAIPNRSIGLTPFAALLLLPTDRLFLQGFAAVSFDANGTAVHVNPALTGLPDSRIGNLRDGDLLQLDLQLGYWIVRDGGGWMRGLAPFVELHSNQELNEGEAAANGGFVVGNLTGRLDELNLSSGFISKFGDNLLVSTGVVVPLRNGNDRVFDYQVGLRASWLFGASARNRPMPTAISSF